jgi:glycosyltransferase involved in cell wall biosynthesis
LRIANALRFQRAGLRRLVREIAPDVFQAHFVVEHGLFGAMAGYHPYVVNAWGSDLLQAPGTAAGRLLASYVLRQADLLSANDPSLAAAALRLGMPAAKVAVVSLGLDRDWLDGPVTGVNLQADAGPPTVVSDRALEALYNIDTVIRAFAQVQPKFPGARLRIAGAGSGRGALEMLARSTGASPAVEFTGRLEQGSLRTLLAESQVYVSVPSSDSFPLSTMEAMAAGAFPVVSDLESQDGWITHRFNGLRVPARDVDALASSLEIALRDHDLRRRAVKVNRSRVEADGDLEKNMLALERHFYRLAGVEV